MHPHLRLSFFERSFFGAIVGICLFPPASFGCQRLVQRDTILNVAAPDSPTASVTTKPQHPPTNLASWQGEYNFIENVLNQPHPKQRSYRIRISLARCGWRAFVTINGPQKRFDIQAKAVAIDENTIGIHYEQDQVPRFRQQPPFRSGELLLRIRRTIPTSKPLQQKPQPIYRIDFEGLAPLIPAHQKTGLQIAAPNSAN